MPKINQLVKKSPKPKKRVQKKCAKKQRAWLALHILTEVKNVTILKGMFLCKIVSSEELVVVVALHIFESDCYNFSLWESRKYGGPQVVKFMFKNCNLHFSSVGYSYSMTQPCMSIMCTKLIMSHATQIADIFAVAALRWGVKTAIFHVGKHLWMKKVPISN